MSALAVDSCQLDDSRRMFTGKAGRASHLFLDNTYNNAHNVDESTRRNQLFDGCRRRIDWSVTFAVDRVFLIT
jgi:hypothetical protein